MDKNARYDSKIIDKQLLYYKLPERSRLYSLPPCNIGTLYVESLTSYISRLAYEHAVTTGDLIKGVIANKLNLSYLKDKYHNGAISIYTDKLCSYGKLSEDYISALENLTGRIDIVYTTLLPFKSILNYENVIKKHKEWCPRCLYEFENIDGVIYEPLIWQMKLIEHCPKHRSKLRDKCHNCNKKLFAMQKNYVVGFCYYCNVWLGEEIDNDMNLLGLEEKLMHELFLYVQSANFCALPVNIHKKINNLFKLLNIDNGEFGSLFGIKSRGAIIDWKKNRNNTSVSSLINFCINTSTSIVKIFLEGDFKGIEYLVSYNDLEELEEKNFNIRTDGKNNELNLIEIRNMLVDNLVKEMPLNLTQIEKTYKICRKTIKQHFPYLFHKTKEYYSKAISVEKMDRIKHDLIHSNLSVHAISSKHNVDSRVIIKNHPKEARERIEYTREQRISKKRAIGKLLQKIIIEEKDMELSMNQIAKKYGYQRATLLREFPDLCGEITERHRTYVENRKKNRKNKLFLSIYNCIIELHSEGVYPSTNKIQDRINNQNAFRGKAAMEYRKCILEELGYNIT
jgi:TniQ